MFRNGATAIYIASGCGHLGVVSTLLQFSTDPNLKTSDGWTNLMIACHIGENSIVELLLKANLDVNACSENGPTGIYLASGCDPSGVV